MRDTTVLVVGSQIQALPVLRALRARGFRAWSDAPEHIASDGVSLAWADALVVIETDRYEHPPAISDFTKPRLLTISTPLDDAQLVSLLAPLPVASPTASTPSCRGRPRPPRSPRASSVSRGSIRRRRPTTLRRTASSPEAAAAVASGHPFAPPRVPSHGGRTRWRQAVDAARLPRYMGASRRFVTEAFATFS